MTKGIQKFGLGWNKTRIIGLLIAIFIQAITVGQQRKECFKTTDTLANTVYLGNIDQKAKYAVGKIMRYTGLPQNFIIISEDIRTAIAYIKNKERYIAYNDQFITRITDSTETDWAATSILAHEIAHHLAGHTINPKKGSPGDELEADIFSGFILYRMGANLDQALAAMTEFKPDTTNPRYPSKQARLLAIRSGWEEAKKLTNTAAINENGKLSKAERKEELLFRMTFNGDKNNYYIDDNNKVIWFDNYGTPIVIGEVAPSETKQYKWSYTYQGMRYGIDFGGQVWMMTDHGAMINAGRVYEYQ